MRPRLGFLGLGWIGRHRLAAVADANVATIAALADVDAAATAACARYAPGARCVGTLEALLNLDLDGVVIATPSAHHAAQAIRCLERGVAVFCQKPLARSASEAHAVVDAARRADRRLDVDFCYRHTAATVALQQALSSDVIGRVFAADLVFHNAYGPGQDWYYTSAESGGGCLMDLGIHLVDQLVWLLDWRSASVVDARAFRDGRPWSPGDAGVEDFASAVLEGPDGAIARLACSWRASVGRDAQIQCALFGARGGLRLRNVNGSFFDFRAEWYEGTRGTTLVEPPDDWGGRRVLHWVHALAVSRAFVPDCEAHVRVSAILDDIYRAAADKSSLRSCSR